MSSIPRLHFYQCIDSESIAFSSAYTTYVLYIGDPYSVAAISNDYQLGCVLLDNEDDYIEIRQLKVSMQKVGEIVCESFKNMKYEILDQIHFKNLLNEYVHPKKINPLAAPLLRELNMIIENYERSKK